MTLGIIGVRFAKGCHPNDLWTKYFTSSGIVKRYRTEHGEPDVVQIRQVFDDSLQAREWEETVIRRMDAVNSERWLNQQNAGKYYCCTGEAEARRLMSCAKKMKGIPRTPEHRAKISEARRGQPSSRKGAIVSDETKAKMSVAAKGMTTVFDTITETNVRVSKDVYLQSSGRYLNFKSSAYREWKREAVE
jgi:hypothetical protein